MAALIPSALSEGTSPTAPPHLLYEGCTYVFDPVRGFYRDGPSERAPADARVDFVRASNASYIDQTGQIRTVGADRPRMKWDPKTHRHCGLMVEGEATNLKPYSDADTMWTAAGTTPPTVVSSQVRHGMPCAKATFPAGGSIGFVGSRIEHSSLAPLARAAVLSGVTYAMALDVSLSRPLVGAERLVVYWTGNFGTVVVSLTPEISVDLVDQWGRISATLTAPNNGSLYPTVFVSTPMASPIDVYVARAQMEAGAVPTSYIQAVANPAARAADVATLSLPASSSRPASGEVRVEFVAPPLGATGTIFMLGPDDNNCAILEIDPVGALWFKVRVEATEVASASFGPVTPGAIHRAIVGWMGRATNGPMIPPNQRVWTSLDGERRQTVYFGSVLPTVPAGILACRLGARASGANPLQSTIRAFAWEDAAPLR